MTITYTSNSNYYINSITINSSSVTINTSEPSSYSTRTNICRYKVWRSAANAVTVILNNCTAAVNVVGNVGNTVNLNDSSSYVSNLSYSRATYNTTTATITGTVTSGYSPQLRYGASEYVTLYNTSGSGTLGGINYSYSKSGTTFTITITGISTGVSNIPTVYISAQNSVALTFNVSNASYGTVSATTGNYTIGSTITVYAAPATNCAFMYWTDSTNPGQYITSNPLVVQVSTARTYTAVFSNSLLDGVAVSVECATSTEIAAVGEARITGYTNVEGVGYVHFSAVAYTGYRFVGWRVDGTILSAYTNPSVNIPLDIVENKQVYAVFEPINQNISNETDNNQTNDFV